MIGANSHQFRQSLPLHVHKHKLQNHLISMVFIENTGLIPHHISTIHQQGLSNGLLLHPLPCHWSSHLCHCRNFTTSTGSLMRLAKFPVDSTPSTKRTERESESMIGGWRGGEEKYKKKGQESTGEWRGFLSRAGINRTPGMARSEPGSPESTYHRGPPHACYSKAGATRGLPGLHFTNAGLDSPC